MQSQSFYAAAAVRRGTRHTDLGLPCQDAVCLRQGRDKATGHTISAAVLCDGAGSVPYAREGAQAVSEAVAGMLVQGYSRLESASRPAARQTLMRCVRRTLSRMSRALGCPVWQLASTLVAVALDETARTMLTIHLGDGVILGLDGRGRAVSLSAAENGRFCNETWFTTSRDATRHLRLGWHDLTAEELLAVCLSSDGLPLCGEDGAPVPGLETRLSGLASMLPEAVEVYLEQMLACESTYSGDDLSMVCLADREACYRLAAGLTPGCMELLRLLRAGSCTTVQAARLLHTCPRRVRIWREKLAGQLLAL